MREVIGRGEDNRRLAKKILAQREAEAQLGIHRISTGQTPRFADFARDWLRRKRGDGLAPKTLESYEDFIEHHFVPWFGEMRLGAITVKDVQDYKAHKIEAPRAPKRRSPKHKHSEKKTPPPLSPRTVGHHITCLKAILADAVEHGHMTANPAAKVKLPQRADRENSLHYLLPDEIARLPEVAEDPWRMLYTLAVHTGMRRGELLGLRWSDLDMRKGRLLVRRSLSRVPNGRGGYDVKDSPLKTRHSLRSLDLSPSLVDALLTFPAGDDPAHDYVLRSQAGGPIDPDNVDRAWKRHLTAAGLADRPFHSTRHTHATLLIAAGVHPKAIQARLGHASTYDDAEHIRPPNAVGLRRRGGTPRPHPAPEGRAEGEEPGSSTGRLPEENQGSVPRRPCGENAWKHREVLHADPLVPLHPGWPLPCRGRDPAPDRRRDRRHDPLHRPARSGESGDCPRHRERVLACSLGRGADMATRRHW
ncbi:MAG TPA: site-specific integrase [bacterium]